MQLPKRLPAPLELSENESQHLTGAREQVGPSPGPAPDVPHVPGHTGHVPAECHPPQLTRNNCLNIAVLSWLEQSVLCTIHRVSNPSANTKIRSLGRDRTGCGTGWWQGHHPLVSPERAQVLSQAEPSQPGHQTSAVSQGSREGQARGQHCRRARKSLLLGQLNAGKYLNSHCKEALTSP